MTTTTTSRRQGVVTSAAIKVPCRVATTANITLSGEQTIDGVAVVTNDRVLVKNQTSGVNNGIYDVATGTWSRARDWDGDLDVKKGTLVYVHSGSTTQGYWYVSTADTVTVGTTSVTFGQASSTLAVISAFVQTLLDDADSNTFLTTLTATRAEASATAVTVLNKVREVVSVKDFGAVGNGINDDTAEIQAAINAAILTGAELYIPSGTYKTTAALTINGRITIRGAGYQGDNGEVYLGQVINDTTGYLCACLLPGDHNCIEIATNSSVQLLSFQIIYPVQPAAGVKAISGDCGAGATSANTYSCMRDMYISGADVGVQLLDWYDFVIDNVNIANAWTTSMSLKVENYPSFSDSVVTNCTMFSGACSYHILVNSSGGLKIENNKLNASAATGATAAIYINPTLATIPANSIEPFLICGNSMEGQDFGVLMVRDAASTTSVAAMLIASNQIYVAKTCIQVNDDAGATWVTGLNIASNMFTITGNAAVPVIALNGSQIVGIFSNVATAATGTGNIFAQFGAGMGRVIQSGNSYSGSDVTITTVTAPAVPASAVTTTNDYPHSVCVNIYGGTGTLVQKNGTTILSQAGAAVVCSTVLTPDDTISITYTVVPTWVWTAVDP